MGSAIYCIFLTRTNMKMKWNRLLFCCCCDQLVKRSVGGRPGVRFCEREPTHFYLHMVMECTSPSRSSDTKKYEQIIFLTTGNNKK